MLESLRGRQSSIDKWPYPIRYGQTKYYDADVAVLGGGISGCWAAIAAAREGAKVIIVEKNATVRSGAGGAGVDHWQWAADNPCSKLTPEELTQALIDNQGGYRNGISTYIQCVSAFETLLELEQMGGKIRDEDDDFKGAEFRDEATKLCFAYDYQNRFVLRVWGENYKKKLRDECRRLGVRIVDRVAVTALLTQDGRHGQPVIGATGVNTRTGEFNLFRAPSVIISMSRPQRNWTFSSELRGISSFRPPSIVGNGFAMAWRIGAEFTMMEKSMRSPFCSPYSYPAYGSGNAVNTYYACNIVDANGKEVPWVDAWGRELNSFKERYLPAEGQRFFIMGGGGSSHPHEGLKEYLGPKPIPDLEERVLKGEFTPPFYADLAGMPEHERNAIWGLMVGNEGKTRVPVYETYMQAGFDASQDMLQTYDFLRGHGMREPVLPQERTFGEQGVCGGLMVDWDLMSNVQGLFGAGDLLYGGQDHSHAATTGRYAGKRAARYAASKEQGILSEIQVKQEMERVYAPVKRNGGMHWKEFNAATARIMQNYCSEMKNEELLKIALVWLKDMEDNEMPELAAENPHKLMRTLDVMDILTCNQMIVEGCRARKASNTHLHFRRLDYPEMDPKEWHKFVTVRNSGDRVEAGERSIGYWGDFESNYRKRL